MESVWAVSKLSTESVGSRRELVANYVHTAAPTHKTVSSRQRRRCVYWALATCYRLQLGCGLPHKPKLAENVPLLMTE